MGVYILIFALYMDRWWRSSHRRNSPIAHPAKAFTSGQERRPKAAFRIGICVPKT